MSEFRATTRLEGVSAEDLYAWHARPGAFQRLAPPWQRMEIVRHEGTIEDGAVLVFRVRQGPLAMTWEAHHEGHEPGRQFRDVQRRGPFARWAHTHRFEPDDGGARLDDRVEYRLPLHPLSHPVAGWAVRRMLGRMFAFRHRRTQEDLVRHRRFADRPRLTVAITGASGMVGRALAGFLTTGGHTVRPVSRRPGAGGGAIHFDPAGGATDGAGFEGVDAVVHLAGEPISQRWSDAARQRIRASRDDGTRALCQALAALEHPPRVLVSASAIGIYGDRGDERLDEDAPPGDGFLADVCRAWEQAAAPARDAGIRVVHPRIGIVLSPQGGALARLLPLFRAGAGGPLGPGRQFMSWIALDDLVGVLHHAVYDDALQGPVNAVAPHPVRNRELTRTLARVLRRPALVPTPRFGLRVVMGRDAADELLLASQRVVPAALERSGFAFDHPDLEGALRQMLGRAG